MISLDMATFISFMTNHKLWMCSKTIRLKLRINSTKGLKASGLTVVASNMADMTNQVYNVLDRLLNS